MAQTKTKPQRKSKARAASKQRSRSSGSKAGKPKASKPRSNNASSSSVPEKAKAVEQAIESGAKEAGGTVAHAVSKAKVPLLAGGAALAGVAGGAALGAHQARRHRGIGGVSPDDLGKAARRVGNFGAQMGEVAIELRRAHQAANGKQHRSPVEVVLEGLTSRR